MFGDLSFVGNDFSDMGRGFSGLNDRIFDGSQSNYDGVARSGGTHGAKGSNYVCTTSIAMVALVGVVLGIIAILGIYKVIGAGALANLGVGGAFGLFAASLGVFVLFCILTCSACCKKRGNLGEIDRRVDNMSVDFSGVSEQRNAQETVGIVRAMIKARLLIKDYYPLDEDDITYGAEFYLLLDATFVAMAVGTNTDWKVDSDAKEALKSIRAEMKKLKVDTNYLIHQLATKRYEGYDEGILGSAQALGLVTAKDAEFEGMDYDSEKIQALVTLIQNSATTYETTQRAALVPALQAANQQKL